MKNRLKRSIALIITFAMIISMLPSNLIVAKATESAGTVVYLKDTIGGETRTLSESTSDNTKGWAWNAETATLTLSGFNGEYIEADNHLNIVLNGTNTVTVPSSGGIGIEVAGKLTIDDTTAVATDILNVRVEDATGSTKLIETGGYGTEKNLVINGGTVNLTGTTVDAGLSGVSTWVRVDNDAILNVDLSDKGNGEYLVGCSSAAYFYTSSPCSISVNSENTSSYAIYSCYYYGEGALNISALGKSKTVESTFAVYEDAAGPINVKGYISGSTFYSSGKWRVKDCDSYIWDYYTLNQTGYNNWLISDSNGNAIKDPVIEKVDNLPLRFMDSPLFDEESIKVGDSYDKKPYWYYGCEGGTGLYRFALAEDSAPLPDGITVDGAGLSGTATSTHPGGTAKIKVTSGSESATFEITYGAIVEPDYMYTIAGAEYNMKEDGTGTGWSYESDTKTLTLSGYNSGPITAEKDLNIILNGTNTVTVPSSGGIGIEVAGKLTIDDTTAVATDILNVRVEDATGSTKLIETGGYGTEKNLVINGGTVNLTGTTVDAGLSGVSTWVRVDNDAILNVDLSDKSNGEYVLGCSSAAYFYTSSPCSISVNSEDTSSYAIYSCYYYGEGALNISALGKSKTVESTFLVDEDAAGPVNVKGYISGNTFCSSGKWRVKDCDSYIWNYYTLDQTGYNSWLISDSNGNAIKDPVIEKVDNLPLKFMDSSLFDEESIKVGDSYDKKPYWYYGCEGGTGSYRFALAEDSAPLPDGITVDGAGLSGTATSIHPAGTAKIKVTSGSESATFEINYGAVTYKNPVTGVNLDKEEIILNKDESTTLTATVLPDTADNCDVEWSDDSSDILLTEDDDESDNTRKATVEAKSYADTGVYNVTVTTDVGSFQKTCKVYVKETKPAGEADGDYIVGLKADAGYTVNGVAKTADSNGRIFIEDSWRKTTVSIVKTNTEAKCNSDVQELAIGGKELQANKVTLEYSSVDYDGTAKTPIVIVMFGDTTLTETTDYTLEYSNNTNAGTAKVTVTGTGLYSGTVEKTFTIMPLEMTGITVSGYNGVYDGNSHSVEVTGLPDGATITYATEYEGEYTAVAPQRTEAGSTRVYYRIVKDNYKTIEGNVYVTVEGVDISDADIVVKLETYTYDGTAKEPGVGISYLGTVLVEGTDYTVTYENNVNAGIAMVTITGKGAYEGSYTKDFTIEQKAMESNMVAIGIKPEGIIYDGNAKEVGVAVEWFGTAMVEGTDYEVSYTNNVNAGSATVTVTGIGNYTGSVAKSFTIQAKAVTPTVTLNATTFTYNGKTQKPTVTVKDGSSTLAASDYTVTYASGCTNVGTYKVTVTLKGNYSGTATASYTIKAKSITPTVTLSKTSYTYNGKVQKPTVTVKDGSSTLAASNYTVTFASGCTNAGTYKVTVTLKGNYSGSATASYTIKAKSITPTVTLSKTSYTYNGKVQKPTVTVKDGTSTLAAANYTVTYSSGCKNVGTYKVTVKLKGNYSGSVTKSYTIKAKAVTPKVTLSKTTYTYNGKAQKPTVTVKVGSTKLSSSNYTVTYASGCKNVGTYKVTVKLKGNYSGSATKTFTINPKATSVSKLTTTAKKRLTVTWKKLVTQTSGYQIQYSTYSSFKNAKNITISKNTTTKKTVTGLKSGKRYYVRIRTYKTVKVNGKSTKIYSSWSKAKSIKVK